MFRLWGKIYKNNKIIKDYVFEFNKYNDKNLDKIQKTNIGMEDICQVLDIEKPLWLEDNYKHFNKFNQTIFKQDHFIETIDFDYFEIELIEDDD